MCDGLDVRTPATGVEDGDLNALADGMSLLVWRRLSSPRSARDRVDVQARAALGRTRLGAELDDREDR